MVTYRITSQNVTIIGDVTKLWCINNKLTALDLSPNTALNELDCNHNQLTELDLSPNLNLTALWCERNKLTELDLSNNTKLTKLWFGINQLTTLDVSHNTALTGLGCYANELTAMDLSHNTDLVGLWCYGNQIKGEEMTRMVNSLPDRTGKDTGTFVVIQDPEPEGNVCLKSDVAIAEGKNWTAYIIDSNDDQLTSYEGEEPTPFTVTFTKVGEGTLTATGATDLTAVPYGTELTVVATPATGYELTALTANSTDILATKKFTVTADTEVKATFAKKTAADRGEAGTLRLYPNPASAYVNVKAARADALVRLYDANGSLRYEARTDADGTLQIDLSAYAEGTYLLRVGDDAQRILIQR